jgi:hypothetical protein
MIACCRCKAYPSSNLSGRQTHRQTVFSRNVHQQEEDHGHKEKIMVSQTEDSRQAAAKGEEEQLA